MNSILRYTVTGGIGFFCDLCAYALFKLFVPPEWSRLASFLMAVSITFYLHTHFTFKAGGRFLGFLLFQIKGFLISYLIFMLGIKQFGHDLDYLFLITGSGTAFVFNYLVSKYLVFRL